jgi:hypothetical protein
MMIFHILIQGQILDRIIQNIQDLIQDKAKVLVEVGVVKVEEIKDKIIIKNINQNNKLKKTI